MSSVMISTAEQILFYSRNQEEWDGRVV